MERLPALRHSRQATAHAPAAEAPRIVTESLLPLWLTQAEAEAVLMMCAVAPEVGPQSLESEIFVKLGELLRAFYG